MPQPSKMQRTTGFGVVMGRSFLWWALPSAVPVGSKPAIQLCAVIRSAGFDGGRPVKLFCQHHTYQFVRPDHFAEGY